MTKYAAPFAAAVVLAIFALAVPGKTPSPAGSWSVDEHHSDAVLSTDGTTDFGKTKTTFTVGLTRVNGTVRLDEGDSANSAFDFRMYPASSMAPPIDEEGRVKLEWFTHYANMTLLCFHSKGAQKNADGRLQSTGTLVLTRVDRNVELNPSEGYSGPVYGPPMVHRLTHEATFMFEPSAPAGGTLQISGSTRVVREDFPQLLKTVLATYWPPVVQDRNCMVPSPSEAYSGAQCAGMFLMAQRLPDAPQAGNGEDYPGPANFNSVVGGHLAIAVHLRLTPNATQGAAGN